jgi:hypothetical protein
MEVFTKFNAMPQPMGLKKVSLIAKIVDRSATSAPWELYSKSTSQLQEHPDGPGEGLPLIFIPEVECSRKFREHRHKHPTD